MPRPGPLEEALRSARVRHPGVRSALWRYAVAVLLVLVGTLVRVPLQGLLRDNYGFITFFPAVALVAIIAGGRAGMLATVLSALAANWFFMEPKGTIVLWTRSDVTALVLFVAAGSLISAMGARLTISATRARKAEGAVRESEQRLRLATEAAGIFSWECDLTERTMRWSANAAEVIGCRPEALPREMARGTFFVAPEDALRMEGQLAEDIRARKATFTWEFRGKAAEGRARHWRSEGRIVYDGRGAAFRVLGVTQEITRHKERQRNLAFLAEVGKEFGVLGSEQEIMKVVGTKVSQYLGVDACNFADVYGVQGELAVAAYVSAEGQAHLSGRRVFVMRDYFSEELLRAFEAKETVVVRDTASDPRVLAGAYAGLGVRSFVSVPFHRQGRWRYLLSVSDAEPREWSEDEVELFENVASRMFPRMERARAEEALRQEEERLRLAVEGGNIGTWELDFRTGRSIWNEREFDLLGLETSEEPGADALYRVVHPDDAGRVRESVAKARETGAPWEAEFRVVLPKGQVRWLAGAGRVSRNEKGEAERMVGVNYDITQRKAFAAELERLVAERTEKLQELVGELEHFSYTITHDMRAPLRAMRAFAQAIIDPDEECNEQEKRAFLGRIITAAERMDGLIADALSYSKAVRQELPLEPVDVGRLVRGMVDSYPEFQNSNAEIEIARELPAVMGNEAGLTQCFSNLLGNAVKFAKPGEKARVRVRAEEHEGRIRLWVEDNGIGISPKMRPRVFQMFSRGASEQAGMGIGLALVRKVTDRMGGKVGVESEPGKGSRFWIELKGWNGEALDGAAFSGKGLKS